MQTATKNINSFKATQSSVSKTKCGGAKEKLQNVPRFEMDFVLNFAMCSADFTCVNGSTIQIVFSELP